MDGMVRDLHDLGTGQRNEKRSREGIPARGMGAQIGQMVVSGMRGQAAERKIMKMWNIYLGEAYRHADESGAVPDAERILGMGLHPGM